MWWILWEFYQITIIRGRYGFDSCCWMNWSHVNMHKSCGRIWFAGDRDYDSFGLFISHGKTFVIVLRITVKVVDWTVFQI
jgi:hypothetical protein